MKNKTKQNTIEPLKNGMFSIQINGNKISYNINGVSLRDILWAMENIPELKPVITAYNMRVIIRGEINKIEFEELKKHKKDTKKQLS